MRAASLTSLILCLVALGTAWLVADPAVRAGQGLAGALLQPLGLGLITGVLLGCALSGFGIAIQAQLAEQRPALLLPGLAIGFGIKFVVLVACAGAYLIWPELSQRLHPVAALGSYAIAAFVVLMAGTTATARAIRSGPGRSGPAAA